MNNQPHSLHAKRQLLLVGIGSLLNDISSEMIYPFLPIFLTVTLHAPVSIIGFMLGFAEALSNFSKLFFGWLSDRLGKRKWFIVGGYTLSGIEKMVMGFAPHWSFVMVARTADRFGKGMRTPPRDALIADHAPANGHGKAFGLHRTLDSTGGVLGPLIGLFIFWSFGFELRPIFFFTVIPSLLCVFLLALSVNESGLKPRNATHFSWNWVKSNKRFCYFLGVTCLFGLAQSSDLFFILRSYDLGFSLVATVFAYVSFQGAQVLFSFPAGIIADRIGIPTMLMFGYVMFAALTFAWAIMPSTQLVWILFPLYGCYMALTEGMSKAYIATIVDHEHIASAFGLHQGLVGTCALFASWIAGMLWTCISSSAPFFFSMTLALTAVVLFACQTTLHHKS